MIYREATSADVPSMEECRLDDPEAGAADPRMAAYLEGRHHPQQALAPRTGFVAIDDERVVGYVAGHRTRRFDCDGEVQYLYVTPSHRRRGVAGNLLQALARWFKTQGIAKVCVDVNPSTAGARPFYLSQGATRLNDHWCVWENIRTIVPADDPS